MCYLPQWPHLEKHHVFPGANRNKSEDFGAVMFICHNCHVGRDGVQYNRPMADYYKSIWQKKLMRRHGWTKEQFIKVFGKNYIKEEKDA